MLYQLIRLILSEQRSDSVPDFKLFGLKLRKAEWPTKKAKATKISQPMAAQYLR